MQASQTQAPAQTAGLQESAFLKVRVFPTIANPVVGLSQWVGTGG